MVNAITQITTPSFPALHPKFGFAALIERVEESEGGLALRFVRETENEDQILIDHPGNDAAPDRVQFYLNFPAGIRLMQKGPIQFRVDLREGDGEWYTTAKQSVQVLLSENK